MRDRTNATNQLCIFLTDEELAALRRVATRMGYPTVDSCVEELTAELALDQDAFLHERAHEEPIR